MPIDTRVGKVIDGDNVVQIRPWLLPAAISNDEWRAARLHPRSIVEPRYLYADVGELVAPGSTAKTTFTLYEMVCIVLGIRCSG